MIALLIAVALLADAGADTGRIEGTITAGPHAVAIADANVFLKLEHVSAEIDFLPAHTDASGHFAFAGLRTDTTYTIRVHARGLRPFTRTAVALRAGEITRLDVNLEVADVHDAVDVTGVTEEQRGALR